MKKFLSENWYKLMTGTSMLVFSFGFLIYAVSPTYANNSNKKEKQKVENTNTVNVPVNKDGSVNIKLSDEQIELLRLPAGRQEVVLCHKRYSSWYYSLDNNGAILTK
tara:strand:+ start:128 stop:448 length:321 start_codon:yes stop_codon:yes gene_type:complete